jgi:nickel-dependent lactate racemase
VKSIAVGVAGEETIGATHNYEMLKQTRLGVVEGNEFRRFLTEATHAVGLQFIVNVVQTGKKEVVKVVAGDPVMAFLEGVKTARALYEVAIDEPGEIVISGVTYPKTRPLSGKPAVMWSFSVPGPSSQRRAILIPVDCEDGCGHRVLPIMKRSRDPEK